jgi:hypothetical protein
VHSAWHARGKDLHEIADALARDVTEVLCVVEQDQPGTKKRRQAVALVGHAEAKSRW